MAQSQQEAALLEVRAALKKIEEHDEKIQKHDQSLKKARQCIIAGAHRINALEGENDGFRKRIASLTKTLTSSATRASSSITSRIATLNHDEDAPALGVTPTSVSEQEVQVAAQQPVEEEPHGAAVGVRQTSTVEERFEMMCQDCVFALFLRVLYHSILFSF